jgi:hypothetical protein
MTDHLMPFLLAVLTPFLTAAGIPDPDLARQAATETIQAYKATTQDQLVTTAQIIAFAFASLDNLRLSAPENLSLSMKLKLRGNANALNRASQKAAAALEIQRRSPTEAPATLQTAKIIVQRRLPIETPAAPTPTASTKPDNQTDRAWASAMTDVAAEITAELPNLPPAQRRTHLAHIGALSETARLLGSGNAPPLKARLLGSTSLNR